MDANLLSLLDDVLRRPQGDPAIKTVPGLALGTMKGVRSENQDRALAVHVRRSFQEPPEFIVVALSDGMGGMIDGGGAATVAIVRFVASVVEGFDGSLDRLEDAAHNANLAVFERYGGRGGATLVAAIVLPSGDLCIVHCGDSRLYALTPGLPISLLTRDDTVAGLDAGADLESEMDNRLLNFVGIGARLAPTHSQPRARPGAAWLLTTDGAHLIGRRAIERIFAAGLDAADATKGLIDMAAAAGGSDNATVGVLWPEKLFHERLADSVSGKRASTDESLMVVWTPAERVELR
jgi:serine/threonine protein phosphatase PrpC